jgi:hypothetical protein
LAAAATNRHDRAVRSRLSLLALVAVTTLGGCVGSIRHEIDRAFVVRSEPSQLVARRRFEPFDVERATESDDPRLRADDAAARPAEDPILLGLKSAVILGGARSVGATSLVLRVPLDGGLFAAFKPDTKKHRERWRGEVAAYRFARGLGLDGVPAAVPRAAKLSALMASIGSSKTKRKLTEMGLPAGDDAIPGAMIAWLPAIKPLPLESGPLYTAYGEWLSQSPPKKPIELRLSREKAKQVLAVQPLAAQISSMIAFDHVTGNRDRWSGHNVMVDETGTRLIFLDNNLAFDPTIDIARTKKRTHVLSRVEKFSRALVANLRGLDRAKLVATMGEDHLGAPLLTAPQLDACLVRRDELLAHVDRLIAKYGEERVLSFE